MEFYINFGIPGLIIGFLVLGWLIGRLDHRAALAETRRDYGTTMLFFLPGVALIQPIGSMVELSGSAAAAWLAACFWKWAWMYWGDGAQRQSALERDKTSL
jgi:biotin transporter BioY